MSQTHYSLDNWEGQVAKLELLHNSKRYLESFGKYVVLKDSSVCRLYYIDPETGKFTLSDRTYDDIKLVKSNSEFLIGVVARSGIGRSKNSGERLLDYTGKEYVTNSFIELREVTLGGRNYIQGVVRDMYSTFNTVEYKLFNLETRNWIIVDSASNFCELDFGGQYYISNTDMNNWALWTLNGKKICSFKDVKDIEYNAPILKVSIRGKIFAEKVDLSKFEY